MCQNQGVVAKIISLSSVPKKHTEEFCTSCSGILGFAEWEFLGLREDILVPGVTVSVPWSFQVKLPPGNFGSIVHKNWQDKEGSSC